MAEMTGNGKHALPNDEAVFAIHIQEGSAHFIKGKLHVLIINDDGSWFAQGLEVDYSIEGMNLEDVQSRFEKGLTATIHEYLKRDGNITAFFEKPANKDYWKLYNDQDSKWRLTFRRKIEITAQGEGSPVAKLDLEFSAEPTELAAK